MNSIDKPIKRSRLRKVLGKEFYILKRKLTWMFDNKRYTKKRDISPLPYSVFSHQSLILRPLKDVEMQLQHNKRKNLEIAISHLNNIVITPGETFSLWKLVGRPTKRKGYLEGLVLNSGKIDKDIGGGLCQLGNLLFWIFAHSPLTITERYRHGYDVFPDINRKVPFGAGATLSYNHIDLQVCNNTQNTFSLKLFLNDTHLCGELFCDLKLRNSYTIEERNHLITQQKWGGYSRHNQIIKITKSEKETQEELLVENHAIMMYSPFLSSKEDKR